MKKHSFLTFSERVDRLILDFLVFLKWNNDSNIREHATYPKYSLLIVPWQDNIYTEAPCIWLQLDRWPHFFPDKLVGQLVEMMIDNQTLLSENKKKMQGYD